MSLPFKVIGALGVMLVLMVVGLALVGERLIASSDERLEAAAADADALVADLRAAATMS